ncbi:MAG: Ig domain-containing protein [Acidobacteriota bacterium]
MAVVSLLAAGLCWASAPAVPTVSSGKGFTKPPEAPTGNQAVELVDKGEVKAPLQRPEVSYAPIVLWNQTLSSVNQDAYVDQDFSDYPAYSSFLLDDFANTMPWSLTAIFVPGNGWTGFTTLSNAASLNWAIYADDGSGQPDGWPGGGNAPFWSLSLPPSDSQVTITNGSGGMPSDTLLTLSAPVALPPGTWWLCFWPEMDFGTFGQYGRQPADTTNGAHTQFINPGGGFGYGTGLQDWSVIGVAQQDMAFRIEGEVGTCTTLYDNGPLVTHSAACGADDASRMQYSSLGMSILGFGHQFANGYRIADDFTLTAPAQIDQVAFFAYQTGAGTTSTITGVYYRIWDGPPDDPGSSVVFGDLTTNRLLSTEYAHIQRDSETSTCANTRYVMKNLCSAGVSLPAGTYWIEWTTDGSNSYSGPWAPPITILGQTTTGNALQYTSSWAPALDSGTSTPQGFPFILYTCAAGCPTITVTPAPPLPAMQRGVFYSVTFGASGGTAPYTFVLTGSIPPGMTWDASTATLSGTPSWVGSYDFTIEVTDASGCTGSESYTVAPAPNYGLHLHDNYGRSDLCIDTVTGSYKWTVLTPPGAVYEGMGVVSNGGTAFWTLPSDPVYIYATYDVRRKRARAYMSNSGSGLYSTIVDTNTTDNGPCP